MKGNDFLKFSIRDINTQISIIDLRYRNIDLLNFLFTQINSKGIKNNFFKNRDIDIYIYIYRLWIRDIDC